MKKSEYTPVKSYRSRVIDSVLDNFRLTAHAAVTLNKVLLATEDG